MKDSLQPGLSHELSYVVPIGKTVPALYPESAQFLALPEVLATGFLVGLLEWACVEVLAPHLDGPGEQSLGTHIEASHLAATPPGLKVTVQARLVEVHGRRLVFEVEAHDGVDLISRARHERVVIDRARFEAKLDTKRAPAPASSAEASADERRRFARIGFDTPAWLEWGHQRCPVTVVDLSFKGVLVKCSAADQMKLGVHAALEVSLGGEDARIRMTTEVKHIEGSLLGLACIDLDLDSMTHLRRLVTLNLGDPALVERGLKALIAG